MGTKGKPSSKKRKNRARNVPPFPFEFCLKVARLREEDGYPALMIAEQFGISEYSVYRRAKRAFTRFQTYLHITTMACNKNNHSRLFMIKTVLK